MSWKKQPKECTFLDQKMRLESIKIECSECCKPIFEKKMQYSFKKDSEMSKWNRKGKREREWVWKYDWVRTMDRCNTLSTIVFIVRTSQHECNLPHHRLNIYCKMFVVHRTGARFLSLCVFISYRLKTEDGGTVRFFHCIYRCSPLC